MRKAWTIIEILVVIAVIALAVAIILPTIASSRASAKLGLTSSRLRQNAAVMHAYASDWRDYLPLPLNPRHKPYRITLSELLISAQI